MGGTARDKFDKALVLEVFETGHDVAIPAVYKLIERPRVPALPHPGQTLHPGRPFILKSLLILDRGIDFRLTIFFESCGKSRVD